MLATAVDPVSDDQLPPLPDEEVERTLETGLQRGPLSDEAMARIRKATFAEFRRVYGRQRERRRVVWLALAAGMAVVAVGLATILSVSRDSARLGTVARLEGAGLRMNEWLRSAPVPLGAPLKVGDRWQSVGGTLVSLDAGGSFRVAPGASFSASAIDDVELNVGRIYVDLPHTLRAFVLRTPGASIEHLGTQFEAFTAESRLRVRVREGAVRVHHAAGVDTVLEGTEIVLDSRGTISRSPIPTYGPEWEWVEAIAPEFEIDDRPVSDFLRWVARETGRRIAYVDEHAQQIAGSTKMHGSVRGLKPLEALKRVLSTTTLRYEIQEGTIRVSSRH